MSEISWGEGSNNSAFYADQANALKGQFNDYGVRAKAAAIRRLQSGGTGEGFGSYGRDMKSDKSGGAGYQGAPPVLAGNGKPNNAAPYMGSVPGYFPNGENEKIVTEPTGVSVRDAVFGATTGQTGDEKLNSIYDTINQLGIQGDPRLAEWFPSYTQEEIQSQYDRIKAMRAMAGG